MIKHNANIIGRNFVQCTLCPQALVFESACEIWSESVVIILVNYVINAMIEMTSLVLDKSDEE